ncbi:hypothetical protein G6F31_018066 [Rhizopus arrhizus]|nr:hypothetical protein G6F31_018066 [Rhizopus arrhizus]
MRPVHASRSRRRTAACCPSARASLRGTGGAATARPGWPAVRPCPGSRTGRWRGPSRPRHLRRPAASAAAGRRRRCGRRPAAGGWAAVRTGGSSPRRLRPVPVRSGRPGSGSAAVRAGPGPGSRW